MAHRLYALGVAQRAAQRQQHRRRPQEAHP
jgi:hypothetical protein